MRTLDAYKPAVSRRTLLLLAGAVWFGTGTGLLLTAYGWWLHVAAWPRLVSSGVGLAAGLLAHRFGFLRLVDRNLARIRAQPEKRCLFSFFPWKSYLLVAAMVLLGTLLRHAPVPRAWLAGVYAAVGLGLLLSSLRYLRVWLGERG